MVLQGCRKHAGQNKPTIPSLCIRLSSVAASPRCVDVAVPKAGVALATVGRVPSRIGVCVHALLIAIHVADIAALRGSARVAVCLVHVFLSSLQYVLSQTCSDACIVLHPTRLPLCCAEPLGMARPQAAAQLSSSHTGMSSLPAALRV